jgi:hypothetical protein
MKGDREDWGSQVNEPVRQQWADANEDEIIPKIRSILLYHLSKRL